MLDRDYITEIRDSLEMTKSEVFERNSVPMIWAYRLKEGQKGIGNLGTRIGGLCFCCDDSLTPKKHKQQKGHGATASMVGEVSNPGFAEEPTDS